MPVSGVLQRVYTITSPGASSAGQLFYCPIPQRMPIGSKLNAAEILGSLVFRSVDRGLQGYSA